MRTRGRAREPAVAAFGRRIGPGYGLADRAEAIATAAHAMAVRFHQGGKLVVFGIGGASTDAQHVAVEFVHPVIVGKRGPFPCGPFQRGLFRRLGAAGNGSEPRQAVEIDLSLLRAISTPDLPGLCGPNQ